SKQTSGPRGVAAGQLQRFLDGRSFECCDLVAQPHRSHLNSFRDGASVRDRTALCVGLGSKYAPRKVGKDNLVAGSLVHERFVDGVSELADVARPGICAQGPNRIRTDAPHDGPALLASEPLHEEQREWLEVL